MASILCGTQARIWTGNREISWRRCRKTPKAGFGVAFFLFGNGAGGRSFAKTKRSGRIMFFFWQGMGRAGPDKGTRHQF